MVFCGTVCNFQGMAEWKGCIEKALRPQSMKASRALKSDERAGPGREGGP